jgi:hypothetical protein
MFALRKLDILECRVNGFAHLRQSCFARESGKTAKGLLVGAIS